MFRRGQIGQTMTWMVATVIIIIISIVFLFITNGIAKTKSLGFSLPSTPDTASGTATQQMLFAILDREVELAIKMGYYDIAIEKAEEHLDIFKKEGINCGFWIWDTAGKPRTTEQRAKGLWKAVSMEFDGKRVRLEC